ncbi:MAG: carboxypeptidase regulatory-like domain-containing protein [Saprospirales bacterium]|nr:carboxypeptidase regulatory-like domain-containing protein [Saprospirales bacterium]
MKKFIFLLSFLLAGLWVAAQPYTISIAGTVLDTNGDPVENVQIIIASDSVPGAPFYFNTVYTDATGSYADSFTTNSTWGFLTVTMVNCPNVPTETLAFVWQAGNFAAVADFVYCDGSGNCGVAIEADSTFFGMQLTAFPSGSAPFVYAWSTGETTPSILVSNPGAYCVTVTDSNGCEAEACIVLPDPQNCFVVIEADPSGGLTAWAQGVAPFAYQWSNGVTTETIFPNAPGQYCVTVTDATGCVSEACYWYQGGGGDSLCSVFIIPQQIPGTITYNLSAIADGEAPFIYSWSTGQIAQDIIISSSGTYCVTVVDATGCESSECITIQIQGQNYQISGYVSGDSIGQPGNLVGKVYLIQYEPNAGTLTAVDSVDFATTPALGGFYSFGNVAPGNYLVKAFLTPGSSGYENFLPTYHFSHLYWDEADQVIVPNNGQYYHISLIPGANPGGPGFIGGLVSDGANIWGGGNEERGGEGDPMPNVSILLLDDQEAPVTHTLTHSDGKFGFENLAWGTYKVVVEIPGLEQGVKWVTIGPDNPAANISFSVGETGIVLAVKEIAEQVESLAYPNPVKDQLSLYFFLEQPVQGQLTLTTLDGRLEVVQPLDLQGGGQIIPVAVQHLPAGIYILQVTTDGWMVSHRVIKE